MEILQLLWVTCGSTSSTSEWRFFFEMFKWNFPYFYLCLLPLVFSLSTAEKSLPLSFSLLHQLFINIDKIPMSLLFQRLNSPGSLTLSSCERCVNPWPYSWLCSRLDIYLCQSLSFTEEPRTGPSTPHMLLQSLLQTPDQFFLVYKYEVQQNASHYWVLDHLCQEVTITALQKPPMLLVPCCAVPSADIGVF